MMTNRAKKTYPTINPKTKRGPRQRIIRLNHAARNAINLTFADHPDELPMGEALDAYVSAVVLNSNALYATDQLNQYRQLVRDLLALHGIKIVPEAVGYRWQSDRTTGLQVMHELEAMQLAVAYIRQKSTSK